MLINASVGTQTSENLLKKELGAVKSSRDNICKKLG